jgi:hypothetical protein
VRQAGQKSPINIPDETVTDKTCFMGAKEPAWALRKVTCKQYMLLGIIHRREKEKKKKIAK